MSRCEFFVRCATVWAPMFKANGGTLRDLETRLGEPPRPKREMRKRVREIFQTI